MLWPENSRVACTHCLRLGVDQVQVDVHLSRDGEVVVIHDATLDRTTNGTGPVADLDRAALARLRLNGTDEGVPTLAEIVALLQPGPCRLRLELKRTASGQPYRGLAPRVLAVLDQHGVTQRTILSAFDTEILAELAGLRPGVALAWLVDGPTRAASPAAALAARALEAGCSILGLRWTGVDRDAAAEIGQAGLTLSCFGCNDEAGLAAALGLGAGEVMTDRPDLALRIAPSPAAPGR